MPSGLPNTLLPISPARRRNDRQLGLEWLRVVGTILVVCLHAGLPYVTLPFPGLLWPAVSPETSTLVNSLCWGINGFIMPLFFLMSGFFAAQLFEQVGSTQFLRHRLLRIGGPALFALLFIIPLAGYIWILGWVCDDQIPFRKLRSLRVTGEQGTALYGVGHVWYLVNLLCYCVAAWGISHLSNLVPRQRHVQTKSATDFIPNAAGPLFILISILIAGSILWWEPRIVIGFRNTWIPQWENLTYYAVPFALGWCWKIQGEQRQQEGVPTSILFIAAILAGVCVVPELNEHLAAEARPVKNAQLPYLWAAFGLLTSIALFKSAIVWNLERLPRAVSYLAKASFWIYLIHLPIVCLVSIDFRSVNWSPITEVILSVLITVALSLLSYEIFVRRTWIGLLLNGYTDRSRQRKHLQSQTNELSANDAARKAA
ncbi:acyltransferase family protein [Planctomicrobium sp. SH527]|uniref:acyltransferase family protein n=1 Tax=Planctomicrobium sp. SH527 TaxID=3448123 RepID=UPI003F5B402C